jgi:hypothetical protein
MAILIEGKFEKCHVKKYKSGNVTITEHQEHYIYKRTATTYTGISIRSLYFKQAGQKTYQLTVFYTANLRDTIQQIKLKALDSTETNIPLKLLGNKKNDNPKQISQVYQASLSADELNYLTKHALATILIPGKTDVPPIELVVTEPWFLADQLKCLINTTSK